MILICLWTLLTQHLKTCMALDPIPNYFNFFGFSPHIWALASLGSFRPESTSCAFTLNLEL